MRWLAKIHAREQRKIVGGLQQPEIKNRALAGLFWREVQVCGDLPPE